MFKQNTVTPGRRNGAPGPVGSFQQERLQRRAVVVSRYAVVSPVMPPPITITRGVRDVDLFCMKLLDNQGGQQLDKFRMDTGGPGAVKSQPA